MFTLLWLKKYFGSSQWKFLERNWNEIEESLSSVKLELSACSDCDIEGVHWDTVK